jgi:hypothetical protein
LLQAGKPVYVQELIKATGHTLTYNMLKTTVERRDILKLYVDEQENELALTFSVEKLHVCQPYVHNLCK